MAPAACTGRSPRRSPQRARHPRPAPTEPIRHPPPPASRRSPSAARRSGGRVGGGCRDGTWRADRRWSCAVGGCQEATIAERVGKRPPPGVGPTGALASARPAVIVAIRRHAFRALGILEQRAAQTVAPFTCSPDDLRVRPHTRRVGGPPPTGPGVRPLRQGTGGRPERARLDHTAEGCWIVTVYRSGSSCAKRNDPSSRVSSVR